MIFDLVHMRRKNIAWAIEQNPTTITIERTEKVENNGGFEENKAQIGPFVVRIFQINRNENTDSQTIGTKLLVYGWGLLADWHSDIRASSNIEDKFEVPNMGLFLIKAVYPQIVKNQIVGYHAALEVIS